MNSGELFTNIATIAIEQYPFFLLSPFVYCVSTHIELSFRVLVCNEIILKVEEEIPIVYHRSIIA